jgi:hypothetical protein
MAPVAGQVLGAGVEGGDQVEARDAARGPAGGVAVDGEQDGGLPVAVRQPRGGDPDHARVPPLTGQDQRRSVGLLGGQRGPGRLRAVGDLALGGPALGVGLLQLRGDRLGSGRL